MFGVASAHVLRQGFSTTDRRVQVFPLSRHLVEQCVAYAELADLVRLNAPVELARHVLDAAAVVRLVIAVGGKRNARPIPISRCGSVVQHVVEHFAHRARRFVVTGIRVPGHQRIDERAKDHRRIVLPVGALQGRVVEDRVDKIDLQARLVACVNGNLVLDEVPSQMQHLVVAAVPLRLVPGEKLAPGVEHRFVPGKLGVDVILGKQDDRGQRNRQRHRKGHAHRAKKPSRRHLKLLSVRRK